MYSCGSYLQTFASVFSPWPISIIPFWVSNLPAQHLITPSISKPRQPTSRTSLLKNLDPAHNNLLSISNRQPPLPLRLHQRIPQTPQCQHIIRTRLPLRNHTSILCLYPRLYKHKSISLLISCWRAAAQDVKVFAWVCVVEESAQFIPDGWLHW